VKRFAIAFGAIALLGISPPLRPQPPEYSDKICPGATVDVRAFDEVIANSGSLVDDAIGAAQKVIAAYDLCAQEKLQVLQVEPMHYAQVRAAQYRFKIGQFQRLSDRPEVAREALQASLAGVKDTIDWRSPGQSVYNNGKSGGQGSSRNSMKSSSTYRDAAIDVRDQTLAEMKLLPPLGGPAQASPAPK